MIAVLGTIFIVAFLALPVVCNIAMGIMNFIIALKGK